MLKHSISPHRSQNITDKRELEETKLQIVRISKGLTQSELAKKSGVTLRTIQYYEQRSRSIDGAQIDTLCRLCIALNCAIYEILEDEHLIEKLYLIV